MTNTDELIIYSNSRNGLGLRILGAKRATNKSGIFIKQILDDGLAEKDGRLKVGDQILSINDESCLGISREHAVNILRSAAATNQVRLRVKHFLPPLSSVEYQKLLYDEKSTDDDEEEDIQRQNNRTDTSRENPMRRSSRREKNRPTTHNVQPIESSQSIKGLDVSDDALQALLNSRFKIIDLFDLLKKIYPKIFSNDQKRELQFIEQISQTSSDDRMTLKDFERQSRVLLGERINLLIPFHSSLSSSNNNPNEIELQRELSSCRAKIDELQMKITVSERSQRLAAEVELEYEDLLKYLYEQLRQYKINEINQTKQLRINDQFIQKLFHYLSRYAQQTNDKHLIDQLKHEYEQQQF